jgi:hypothetical protein
VETEAGQRTFVLDAHERFIDMMEQDRLDQRGGPGQGAKPREILQGPELLAKAGR